MSPYITTLGEEFDALRIRLTSKEDIERWSKGEVKKPETINYRTYKPEKDGLFCEKIFGPVKDWECSCGKYKKVKHRGIVCERCGVEITEAKVRRHRMGHIKLASPVVHIWFYKITPSCIGNLLDLSTRALEKIIYFEDYVVLDPGSTPLKTKQLLSVDEHQKARQDYGDDFKVGMGGEAIKDLLEEIDLDELAESLQREFNEANSKQKRKKINKRLRIVEAMRHSGNKPSWMVLESIPVLPPDLRPLVPLEGGRYATSDLNDLYRRVINRNNRLKRLKELKAPEVIIRNEKRILQEAVDALFDNGRHGRLILGPSNRPLKSLSDMLRGKQGRFRQNLLGKRVDYSGRSVIVVGPELKLHQCGLPKKMALELFEPFIINKLRERGIATTIKAAKRAIAQGKSEIWDILEEVTKDQLVLLNRAPTLHRLGIQAFEPVLIEGKAIRIHPLVCTSFNADFDGDQMAVHVPLMPEAQLEARLLLLSTNNIFSPSNGKPIVTPTQDMVLGLCFLTKEKPDAKGEGMIFSSPEEVLLAYEAKAVELGASIKVKIDGQIHATTIGRVIFNQYTPKELGFINKEMNKDTIGDLVTQCFKDLGHSKTVELLDELKKISFKEATRAGVTISIDDLLVPPTKQALIEEAHKEIAKIDEQYKKGLITEGERYNKKIDIWTRTTERLSEEMMTLLSKENQGFNSVFIMASSGARGSKQQIRQLAAMRGLMAKPSGDIIESPIISNFREGLNVMEYFISTHGARKGLADTALKTADAGYLTRRLVDVAQEVIIMERDCETLNGITVEGFTEASEKVALLKERIIGRVAAENVINYRNGEVIVSANQRITEEKANKIEESGIDQVKIRSVLTCEAARGVCAQCYGINLATGRLVSLGEAVGVIAAQSIGEPGTQLTMRTFHIGGTASRVIEQSKVAAENDGYIHYHNVKIVFNRLNQRIVVGRGGEVSIHDPSGKELECHRISPGAILYLADGEKASKGKLIVEWDPYIRSIITEVEGKVEYEDIIEGLTMIKDVDPATGLEESVIMETKEDKHPEIRILGKGEAVLDFYPIPPGAHINVKEGQAVCAGDLLAKTPRKLIKTKDITGGLPRVAELFEARRPKDPAILSEIDGEVKVGPIMRGVRQIKIINQRTKREKEYLVPLGKHLNVHNEEQVDAGQPLFDGPIVPHDILRILGEKELQEYLLGEIQDVYRLQGVNINDKHIEIIIRQMLKKVRIEEPGDTPFLANQIVDRQHFLQENKRVAALSKTPAMATPILMGITKVSLETDSFIAAASFQQTTKVLTEAAIAGRIDDLRGLKENVIIGHLIPAGTGYEEYKDTEVVWGDGEEQSEVQPL